MSSEGDTQGKSAGRTTGRLPGWVLVVGASAAGLSTVEALRRRGFVGGVTVVGDERHVPYDRPPLSKQALSGVWEPGRAELRTREQLAALDAEFVIRVEE